MKKYLFIGVLALFSQTLYAQTGLNKDLDADGKSDRLWLQDDDFYIKLSGQTKTLIIQNPCDEPPRLKNARVGFIISCDAMRHGSGFHYAYNPTNSKMQVIGYDFWALGNATNDGGGKDSLNLKTGDYIGKWHLRQSATDKLRDHRIKTRLPNIRPINVNDPQAHQQWQALWEAIKQEKRRHNLPID